MLYYSQEVSKLKCNPIKGECWEEFKGASKHKYKRAKRKFRQAFKMAMRKQNYDYTLEKVSQEYG